MALVSQIPSNRCVPSSFEIDLDHELFLLAFPMSSPKHLDTTAQLSNQQNILESPSNANGVSRTASRSLVVDEQAVTGVAETGPADWRRYDPPRELLDHPEGTSEAVIELSQVSIATLQERNREEDRIREAAARRAKPLGRSRRVSGRPKIHVRTSQINGCQHKLADIWILGYNEWRIRPVSTIRK